MPRGKVTKKRYVLSQDELAALEERAYQGQRVTQDGLLRTWFNLKGEKPEFENLVVLEVIFPRQVSAEEVGTNQPAV